MAGYKAACISMQGPVRRKNEDNILFNWNFLDADHNGTDGLLYIDEEIRDKAVVFGLFDGMGGETGGEYASFLAASHFSKLKEEERITADLIGEYYKKANDAIYDYAQENIGRFSGTTANLLIFNTDSLVYSNIGDSKTYLYRDDELRQLSKDHTNEKLLNLQGIRNRKPELTQCLGLDSEEIQIEPYIDTIKLKDQDLLLLCSDGITDMVDLSSKEDLFKSDVDVIVSEMVEEALKNGGEDNATITVIKYSEKGI